MHLKIYNIYTVLLQDLSTQLFKIHKLEFYVRDYALLLKKITNVTNWKKQVKFLKFSYIWSTTECFILLAILGL